MKKCTLLFDKTHPNQIMDDVNIQIEQEQIEKIVIRSERLNNQIEYNNTLIKRGCRYTCISIHVRFPVGY